MNLIKRTIDISKKKEEKNCENLYYTKSMESCPLVISHILAEFHPERATYTTLHNHFSFKNGFSKSAQTFNVGFVKLPSTHPIHIVVWGNIPFKSCVLRPLSLISIELWECNWISVVYRPTLLNLPIKSPWICEKGQFWGPIHECQLALKFENLCEFNTVH